MRVALVIERFLPTGGGMEGVAWQVADALARAGDEVHVLARDAAVAEMIEVHRVPVARGWQPLRVMGFARGVAALTRDLRFDVVHAFSRTLSQDIYRAGGGSHADYMQRAYAPAARAVRRLTPRHALLLSLERRIFERTPIIQCGSAMVRNEIATRFAVPDARLRVIYNGVDTARFHPSHGGATSGGARGESTRDLPRRTPDAPVWLFVGSGWHRKGLDTALRALAKSQRADARLWVVGRDVQAPWRRRATSLGVVDRVDFLGLRSDLECVYPAADALLLPARYDAFANVCLEAAACGLPVVTSGANGAHELFARAGVIVEDPEDVAGFAAALDELSDPARRRALGDEAHRIARAATWEAHVAKLRALYAEVRR